MAACFLLLLAATWLVGGYSPSAWMSWRARWCSQSLSP